MAATGEEEAGSGLCNVVTAAVGGFQLMRRAALCVATKLYNHEGLVL